MVYAANAIHYGWSPSERSRIDDLLAWATALALIALYSFGYKTLLRAPQPSTFHRVILSALPLVLISFVTIPYDSTDVFLYMDVGWAQTHYHLNPYTNVLRDIPGVESDSMIDPAWMRTNKNPWLDLPFVYGFTFALITRGIAWLGHGRWWLTLVLFKLLNVGAYFSTAALVWIAARKLNQPRPDVSLYLFTWSPLILLHHIANAHNDILMGCLIVLAVTLVVLGRAAWAAPVLVVAAMLKYATLPLIPVVLIYVGMTRGWRRATISAMGAASVAALLSLPYAADLFGFRFDLIAAQLNKVTAGSLYAFLYYLYRFVFARGLETFGAGLKVAVWIASAVLIVWELYRQMLARKPSVVDLISVCSFILFAIIFIASSQFYSWYIGMLFPLILLLTSGHWLREVVVILSGTHVLSLTSLSRKGIGYFVVTTGAPVMTWLRKFRQST